MELEVIAEDAYFQPYEETFSVVTSKKATVEVLSKKPSKSVKNLADKLP